TWARARRPRAQSGACGRHRAACGAFWCLWPWWIPSLHLHQVFFFVGDDLVHFLDAVVHLRLHLLHRLLAVVLGQFAFPDRLLDHLLGVTALVADGDLVLLALALDQLDELLAPLL